VSERLGEAVMPVVKGQPFRCHCGCNVLTVISLQPLQYRCNACATEYEGERSQAADHG
jgi:hypothetical protein